jgi:ABC-type branched-subunit amino acid transport system substrate-binding protein
VTATTIKLGFTYVDFACLAKYVDNTQGDDEKIMQVFVDDINKSGGVLGRKLEVVSKKLCPLDQASTAKACTELTDDEKVFAIFGVYDTEPPGDGTNKLCVSRDKETIQINHLVRKEIIDQVKPGLLLTTDITAERNLDAVLSLLKSQNTLAGKKIALLADQNTQAAAETRVKAAATAMGIQQGSTAVLSITNEETTAAQGQLDSFIEKWKSEGVNALVMAGPSVSAKQFVEKIKKAIPAMVLITNITETGGQAKDETASVQKGEITSNPYEGLLTASGATSDETFQSPGVQACVKIYETATGEKVIPPSQLTPGERGEGKPKRVEVYIGIQDRCGELSLFTQIAEKAGANLTNDTWMATVKNFGKIDLVTSPYGSLREGKYDADDAARLVVFDSSIPALGDYKPLSELKDIGNG